MWSWKEQKVDCNDCPNVLSKFTLQSWSLIHLATKCFCDRQHSTESPSMKLSSAALPLSPKNPLLPWDTQHQMTWCEGVNAWSPTSKQEYSEGSSKQNCLWDWPRPPLRPHHSSNLPFAQSTSFICLCRCQCSTRFLDAHFRLQVCFLGNSI